MGFTRARERDAWISKKRDQTMNLRFLRSQLGQDSPETERILAKRGPHPVIAGGRRISFVEDQIDNFENRGQAGGELNSARNLERDVRLSQSSLGPDDSLGDGWLREEECARDLRRGQSAEQTQGQRNLGFG